MCQMLFGKIEFLNVTADFLHHRLAVDRFALNIVDSNEQLIDLRSDRSQFLSRTT